MQQLLRSQRRDTLSETHQQHMDHAAKTVRSAGECCARKCIHKSDDALRERSVQGGSLHSTSHGVLHEDFSAVADTEKATISSSFSQVRRCWELKSSISIRFICPASSSASRLSTPAGFFSFTLPLYTALCPKSFSKSSFFLRLKLGTCSRVPRLLLLVLEALHFFCACFPTLRTSPQFAWPHIHEFSALLGSILAGGLHAEVRSFVNHVSRLRVSCG